MRFFLLSIVLMSLSFAALADCNIPLRKTSYQKYLKGTYYDVLFLPKSSVSDLTISKNYVSFKKFQSKVLDKVKPDPKALMKKQRAFFEFSPLEISRFDKVLSGKVGRLRPASCLEAFLMDNHLRKFSDETEFSAYILSKKDSSQLVAIIYSQKLNGTTTDDVVWNLIQSYRQKGWNVDTHLHNHPFFFKNPYGDIAGTVLPSNADIETYRDLGQSLRLSSATVTNGFHTFILKASEFNLL